MDIIFNIVAALLQFTSYVTGLSYKEINIIVYYILGPFIYISLIDKIFKRHWLKIIFGVGFTIFFLSIRNFKEFSEWLFEKSVIFLLSFEKFGWDYVVASVIICVILPGILFVLLFYYAYKTQIEEYKKILNQIRQ